MRALCFVFAALGFTILVGCGPAPADVKGKVTQGSKTVKFGDITIYGSDGVPQQAKIARDGTFEIKRVASGRVKVAVASPPPKDVPSQNRDEKGPDPVDVANWFMIHPDFGDPAKSGLFMDLRPGVNEMNMNLPERAAK